MSSVDLSVNGSRVDELPSMNNESKDGEPSGKSKMTLEKKPSKRKLAEDATPAPPEKKAKKVSADAENMTPKSGDQTEEAPGEEINCDVKRSSPKKAKRVLSPLDKAIDDLELAVIECEVKPCRRLPKEVSIKLEQVAHHSCNDDTVAKLMRSMAMFSLSSETLKKLLLQMVNCEKDKQSKLIKVKEELKAMVSQCSDSGWSSELEDKVYEYYMVYLEGARDKRRGGMSKKFYMDVAVEMWPGGAMDKNGVKEAVSRAKGREKVKKQNTSS